MDAEQSENNIIIMSNSMRLTLFYKIYKNSILFITIPIILLPVVFLGDKNAYLCFYAFLITATYWMFEVLHPAVVSLIPIALSTIINSMGYEIISMIYVRHAVFDCFGTLIFMAAIEGSRINTRIALKTLLIFGCSHYRLCFILFFTTMLLSMWISNTLACGFILPIVKATMMELEKMGILEVYETTGEGKEDQRNKTSRIQKPSDFIVFYFLGIAYSSTVGGMATIIGSHTNKIFKAFCEKLFPFGPKIEFPQFVLLTLPGVLVLETAVYLWLNFYFLGLFRIHNYSALHTGSTEEEAQFTKTLLKNQYQKLGKISNKELIVGVTILLCIVLQMASSADLCNHNRDFFTSHMQVSAPIILCALILFVIPTNLDFFKFCKRQSDLSLDPLPSAPSKPCLDWKTVKNDIHWTVILVTASSCAMFEALKESGMTEELERFLQMFSGWSAPVLVLVVVVLCKVFTEFANDMCVAHCLLEHVTRVSLSSRINPHYLMLAAILSCSVPFHLSPGTPAHAIVASYYNIDQRMMMYAGIGPSIISIFVIWFTVTVWSKAIWTDINVFPDWANIHHNITVL